MMAKKQIGVPVEEILAELPEERRAQIRARSKLMSAKYKAIMRFRKLKEQQRDMLKSSKQLGSAEIREIEKNADLILSSFREAVETNGGHIKLVLSMPDEIEYNLFDLRDWYEEIEGSPLGPYYEEEDINEANSTDEWSEFENTEQVLLQDEKILA